MYKYSFWPGAYSFNCELKLFLQLFKDFCEGLLYRIAELEQKFLF